MSLLLDTCTLLWILDDAFLRPEAVEAIDDAHRHGQKLLISPATAWEIGLAASHGRLRTRYAPQRWLAELLARPEIGLAELSPAVLLESASLPGDPGPDPIDRIIAATAREHGHTVMTRDATLLDYGRQGHLSVLEC